MFRAILGAVTDPELPVRIQAAIALPELVRYNEGKRLLQLSCVTAQSTDIYKPFWLVRAGMVPNIGRIMQGESTLPIPLTSELTCNCRDRVAQNVQRSGSGCPDQHDEISGS